MGIPSSNHGREKNAYMLVGRREVQSHLGIHLGLGCRIILTFSRRSANCFI